MTAAHEKVNALQSDGDGVWCMRQCDLTQTTSAAPKVSSIVFIEAGELQDDKKKETKNRHAYLQNQLQMPASFWTQMSLDASGFFRAQEHFDDNDKLLVQESWLRLQTKRAMRLEPVKGETLGKIDYHWDRLGFFIRWWPTQHFTVYCFDLPENLKSSLHIAVESSHFKASVPGAIWSLIFEHTLPLFDNQVWNCRNLIRAHEKSRPTHIPSSTERPKPEYEDLHEIARHVIHSTEMLQTALHVLEEIEKEHLDHDHATPQTRQHKEVKRSLSYHKTMLHGFKERSHALEKRLGNEMQLTFHLNSQFDSIATGTIAQSSSEDSAAMRTISFLGLIFLPGTFISAIFSMSFFNFDPPDSVKTQQWRMSSKFWIFWAFCIPVTGVTILLWTWWHRKTRERLRSTTTFYIPESDNKVLGKNRSSVSSKRRGGLLPSSTRDLEKGPTHDPQGKAGYMYSSYASSDRSSGLVRPA